MDADDVEAIRNVRSIEREQAMGEHAPHERAMSLTTTAGGFAVPFVLDPTVIRTSSGAINPYRAISNVIQISVDEWRGVSSDGITAAFAAEAARCYRCVPQRSFGSAAVYGAKIDEAGGTKPRTAPQCGQ